MAVPNVQQHFVPRCFLKQFEDAREMLWMVRKKDRGVTSTSSANVCKERFAYTFNTAEEARYFHGIESQYLPALNAMASGLATEEQARAIAAFVAVLCTRNVAYANESGVERIKVLNPMLGAIWDQLWNNEAAPTALLIPCGNHGFVTSDVPTLIFKAAEQACLVCPVAPSACVFVSSPSVLAGIRRFSAVPEQDASLITGMLAFQATGHIFTHREPSSDLVNALLTRTNTHKTSVQQNGFHSITYDAKDLGILAHMK